MFSLPLESGVASPAGLATWRSRWSVLAVTGRTGAALPVGNQSARFGREHFAEYPLSAEAVAAILRVRFTIKEKLMPQRRQTLATTTTRGTRFRRARRVVATAAIVLGTVGLVATGPATAATVPNIYVRTCSHWTGHCTGYVQTNGPHNWNVPNEYITQWTWGWIW